MARDLLAAGLLAAILGQPAAVLGQADGVADLSVSADVTVTAKKTFADLADVPNPEESLIGIADAASQGAVTAQQIDDRPVDRAGDILESVPGLVTSQHSGEGKANQYYLRGFNLDHGTDFATSVAGIPVNLPSHAHGQGYTDLNFVIPELVSGIQYRKGVSEAQDGDFTTAGAAEIGYVNTLDHALALASSGEQGYGRLLVAQSPQLGEGHLLYAFEAAHNKGPWVNPDDYKKYNGVLRYSVENGPDTLAFTAMGYRGRWNATDQVPDRAISEGLVSRFGAIDPTDGGLTHRYSFSADWLRSGDDARTRITAYGFDYSLNLFSNFTYFLNDPIHGDQIEQIDRRFVTGLVASQEWRTQWFGRDSENTAGLQFRNDNIPTVALYHTEARELLSVTRQDHVRESTEGIYYQNSTAWSGRFRTVLGLREDFFQFTVRSNIAENSGSQGASIFSPKLSVVLGPWDNTEFYLNAGYGFHSNDARGTTITVDPEDPARPASPVTPLVRTEGVEAGLRALLAPHLQTTVVLWGLDIGSELLFLGDAGTTEPSRPSRRTGIEVTNFYRPVPWLLLDADIALSKARFRDFDSAGDRIPGAIENVASAGAAVEGLSKLSGGLWMRYFGPRPLIEDNSVRSHSSTTWSGQIGYELLPGARLVLQVFNMFNAKVSDIDYYYTSRLPGEPADGVADIHSHPAEPRTWRVALQATF
jgi:hypothetical protein